MARLIIEGFGSTKEALNWWSWYEGQGEQDDTISMWMGEEEIRYVDAVVPVKEKIEGDDVTVKVKVTYVKKK